MGFALFWGILITHYLGVIIVGKVNFILEDKVEEELRNSVPPRQRSKLVNEAIKKELLRLKRATATEKLFIIRKKTASYSAKDIDKQLARDRKRTS